MSIIKDLTNDIKEIINETGYEIDNFVLQPSGRRDLGQFQINDAMNLARNYHKNPREIAEDIVKGLEKDKRFENINIAGPGFINISLTHDYLVELMNKVNKDINVLIDKKDSKKVIIDYGGANVAKALHVGHLRSANIGEALKRLALLLGYDALGDAHLGDYGRPLGFVIKEIEEMYPDLPYFDKEYQGDFSEVEVPITNEDLERIYPLASSKAKEDEEYLEAGRVITVKIQQHERGYYDLWKKIVDISKADIKATYEDLNVHFEIWNGESDEMEYFDELKKIYEESGVLKDSEGAKIIEVARDDDKAPMPPLLFIKSNGSASYETTDLATILERKINHNPEEIWYVVDGRQSLHFEQIFRATRKANLVDEKVVLEHVGFGTMNGKDGKPFKTRDGGVMNLKQLIDLVYEETYKKITNDSIKEQEKDAVAKKVAIAALKYADLLPFRGTDYIFEVEKFSDLEGKTGPYLLYSTIRMKSLLNKASELKQEEMHKINSLTEEEIALNVLNLTSVLDKSIEAKALNDIADYLYKITALYNKFYAENKVLTEGDEKLQESWLVLTKICHKVNSLLLDVLAIDIPDKM